MKKFVMAAILAALCVAAYVAVPLWTAWSIRNAIRNGDNPAYLETAIDWPSVKETLKPSLVDMALGEGASANPEDAGFWKRLTTYAGERSADALVEAYATPEGLPLLVKYGRIYRERVKGQIDETDKLPIWERMTRLWKRLKRAEFRSPTRLEFLLADKFTPERHYDGALELKGWRWKMTELRIKMMKDGAPGESAPPSVE